MYIHVSVWTQQCLPPKSEEYIEQKNNIIEKMRNVCGEPDEKNKRKN